MPTKNTGDKAMRAWVLEEFGESVAWEILGSRANTKQELQETIELVAQGHIQPMVDRVFPFAEVEAAFEVLRQGRSLGRNVLAI